MTTKKIYSQKRCVCAKCKASMSPVLYMPTTGCQKYSLECLSEKAVQKLNTNREWAQLSKGKKRIVLEEMDAKQPRTLNVRTPVKRCQVCADQSWRRPITGCVGCGWAFAPETIT